MIVIQKKSICSFVYFNLVLIEIVSFFVVSTFDYFALEWHMESIALVLFLCKRQFHSIHPFLFPSLSHCSLSLLFLLFLLFHWKWKSSWYGLLRLFNFLCHVTLSFSCRQHICIKSR